MNSASLRAKFREIYSNFFSRNDMVMSACFSFPWGHEGSWHKSNYINVKSKVPLKCYVWIRKRQDSKVVFCRFQSFDIIDSIFEEVDFWIINKELPNILKQVELFLNQNWYTKGIDIEVLSETTRGHSFWFSGTFSAILSGCLHVLTWKVQPESLVEYSKFKESEIFDPIFRFWWKLDFISRYWNSSGENVMHALDNSHAPAFLFCEKISLQTELDVLDSKYYSFTTIPELFKKSIITKDISIDYCLIFSWVATETKKVEEFRIWSIRDFDRYKNFVAEEILCTEWMQRDIYARKYVTEKSLYENSSDIVWLLSIRMIDLFKKMFETWYSEEVIDGLIDNVNSHRYMVSILEKQSNFADDLQYFFRKNQANLAEKIWILPAYSWKLWWWYVVVMKPEISRNSLQNAISEMAICYPNIKIEYASYLDWLSSDGLILEQYVSMEKFSEYTFLWSNMFIWSNHGDYRMMDYKTMLETKFDWILLDTINNKIYINWEKLTSKDIPSQNTTIDILSLLLKQEWEEVKNSEFPMSSYSKNKNEMLGKIVIPLIRVIEEKFWDHFPLICKWGLTEFYLKLNKTNIKIYITNKA